jgi:hypothetical protein
MASIGTGVSTLSWCGSCRVLVCVVVVDANAARLLALSSPWCVRVEFFWCSGSPPTFAPDSIVRGAPSAFL